MKHKLRSNFNMNLDSIQSHLTIAEDVDCKTGAIGLTLKLKTNDLEVKLETSYRLKGSYELKYYRNQQMMKHILNGKLIVDQIPNQELVSLMKIDDNNNVSNFSIISLDFSDIDKKLIRYFTEDKISRLVVNKETNVPEVVARNREIRSSRTQVILKEDQDEDDDDDDDDDENDEEPDNRKWRFLSLEQDEENKKPVVTEETTPLENVGQTVTNFIGKGLEMFESNSSVAENKNFGHKKNNDTKKEDQKSSPYTFNEGMS